MMVEQGGIGIVCTEFVRITSNPVSRRHMGRVVDHAPGTPLSVQVMGNDVERMADAARLVAAAGADVVDINLGCPAPRVVRKGVGSAMLKDPQLLFEVLCAMRSEVPGLLSAKIRAGFDDADNVVRIARCVESAGVDYLVVHPRRRSDFYEGVADWRIIRTLKEELSIPVVGNGDCWYAADALRMQKETGCDAVMLGRPALRNPWIFAQIEALYRGVEAYRPSGADIFEWLLRLRREFAHTFDYEGDAPIGRIKELVSWLGRSVDDGGRFRRAALREPDIDAVLRLTEQNVAPLPPEQIDLAASPLIGLERSGTGLQTPQD